LKTFVVRQAVLSDIEKLTPLFDGYRQFYGAASDPGAARKFLLDRFNHGESVLFIALEGEMAAGFAQLYPSFSSVLLRRTFVLNDLYVQDSFRRHGIARRLMSAAAEFAARLGAGRLTLTTATTNTRAQTLYESSGWKRDEQFITYHLAPIAPSSGQP